MSESIPEDGIILLDLVGFYCPIPVHETRKLLDKSESGTIVKVICDDPETKHDMPALCNRLSVEIIKFEENIGEFIYTIKK
ncbi:MAG: response regulator SirA [Euryarchaeota archaeon]|jgi:TusA-related sulfurtransferase|nr:response regulator SirA [Euryarchaeota archaeon]|tara:strand:- start:285 stop:527 length:243 start_codon:yes stop_codon:yes gene_type:complete